LSAERSGDERPVSAATLAEPMLRDLKAKLEKLDDDLGIENLPDDFGRDRHR
jgi:hypothetical protein